MSGLDGGHLGDSGLWTVACSGDLIVWLQGSPCWTESEEQAVP